jgi:D-3-phosphoglycerate dehydrogenase
MKIVIVDDYQNCVRQLACFSLLQGHQIEIHTVPARDESELVSRLIDAEVVVVVRERVNITSTLLTQLPHLKLVALVGRNAKTIDYAACTAHGIAVTHGMTQSPIAPAELTVALILAARRNITVEAERMKLGLWPEYLSHRLSGSTLGIYGYGVIGALVAKAGAGLGMHVLAWGRAGSLQRAQEDGYETAGSKQELFERADVLSLHLRMSAGADHAVKATDLARMKPTSLLVNTARADLIAPGALVDALNAGRPGFAAVDVYEDEPVTGGNHPLLKMPNVVCMPHLGWADYDTFELYFGETFAQVRAYHEGVPYRLLNPEVASRLRK